MLKMLIMVFSIAKSVFQMLADICHAGQSVCESWRDFWEVITDPEEPESKR